MGIAHSFTRGGRFLENLFMTFLTYSFIGWLWESVFCSIKARHFVYRGFLLGPYCPVYGFGVVAVLTLVPSNAGTLLNLYFNAVVIVTIVELVTSWLLEKLFGMKLWDYTKVPFNIEGRVAVPVSLFWGIGCLLLIKWINPMFQDVIELFIRNTENIGPLVIAFLFLLDVLSTFVFTFTTKKEVASVIDDSDPENAAIKEFRLKHLLMNRRSSRSRERVAQFLRNQPMKIKHHNLNRLIKNYPNIRFKK